MASNAGQQRPIGDRRRETSIKNNSVTSKLQDLLWQYKAVRREVYIQDAGTRAEANFDYQSEPIQQE